MSEIPEEVLEKIQEAKERDLTELDLRGYRLTTLPESLGELQGLTTLDLSHNRLTELPEWMGQLQGLTTLDLSHNRLTELPEWMGQLQGLTTLDLSDNSIENIPPEVLASGILFSDGIEKIRAYFRQLEAEGQDYLYEAKLLIVGEGGAGKTTLAQKIKDPNYELQEEDTTKGIEVTPWEFTMENGQPFQVNIWDFGGQEIYKATHQFFLTKRSLYALVADSRKEDTDFNYWLNVVGLFSDNSPLLIVKNEKQDRQRAIDERQLSRQFSNLEKTLATNLATNRGLSDIQDAIKYYVSRLPHIGTALPKTWVNVRKALENDDRNTISLDEYLDICERNGFSQLEDKLQLSGYLHDLGVCLHFQDDPLLKHTMILKPKWGTDAVYRVLDDDGVTENKGRFSLSDLAEIWQEDEYALMHDALLRLMINFKLCFQIPGSDEYIAPQLLPLSKPDYPWGETGNLILRYTYEFMPKGIITRFIVAVHPLIADQEYVWRNGVLVEQNQTRAEVIEQYGKREIKIRIAGKYPNELRAIVSHELDKIHRSYERLKFHELVPCNCSVCKDNQDPHFYPFDRLRKFAEDRQDRIQCAKSYEMVAVLGMVGDLLRIRDRLWKETGLPPDRSVSQPKRDIEPEKEIFVSYAWGGESEEIVDLLEQVFKEKDIPFIRDKNEAGYKERIQAFMTRIGRGGCVVVVISKKYLESENCMFELVHIAKNGDFYDRIFPIVLDDAKIYKSISRLKYVKYWEKQIQEFKDELEDVSPEYLQGFREDLDHYHDVRNTISRLMDIIKDMNTLTPEMHREAGFAELIDAVVEKLAE